MSDVQCGVMINDLFWHTIQDFFDFAYRGGLSMDEHKKNFQSCFEAHCIITAETNNRAECIPDYGLSDSLGEAASLAVAQEKTVNIKKDVSDDLLGTYNLASSRRVNMWRLLHDNSEDRNENTLI